MDDRRKREFMEAEAHLRRLRPDIQLWRLVSVRVELAHLDVCMQWMVRDGQRHHMILLHLMRVLRLLRKLDQKLLRRDARRVSAVSAVHRHDLVRRPAHAVYLPLLAGLLVL